MTEAVVLDIKGIKCDAPGCDYVDDKAEFGDGMKWLGAPCPLCGASLLTVEDYTAIQLIKSAIALTNAEVGPVTGEGGRHSIPITLNGTGEIKCGEFAA